MTAQRRRGTPTRVDVDPVANATVSRARRADNAPQARLAAAFPRQALTVHRDLDRSRRETRTLLRSERRFERSVHDRRLGSTAREPSLPPTNPFDRHDCESSREPPLRHTVTRLPGRARELSRTTTLTGGCLRTDISGRELASSTKITRELSMKLSISSALCLFLAVGPAIAAEELGYVCSVETVPSLAGPSGVGALAFTLSKEPGCRGNETTYINYACAPDTPAGPFTANYCHGRVRFNAHHQSFLHSQLLAAMQHEMQMVIGLEPCGEASRGCFYSATLFQPSSQTSNRPNGERARRIEEADTSGAQRRMKTQR